MKPITRRRILLSSLVIASGCAAFDAPKPGEIIVHAGTAICVGDAPTKAECDRMLAVAASLNSEEMNRRIREAQAFEVIRK